MKNWQEKQYKKQLEHYRPKRTFNHVVDLELPPFVNTITGFQKGQMVMFMSGGKSTMPGRIYPSLNWLALTTPWRPLDEMLYWLNENIGTDYYICKSRGVLAFTKPEDAMAFKLQWR